MKYQLIFGNIIYTFIKLNTIYCIILIFNIVPMSLHTYRFTLIIVNVYEKRIIHYTAFVVLIKSQYECLVTMTHRCSV